MRKRFVFGMDPVFLDILVTPLDSEGNKLLKFPENIDHLPYNKIKITPGGNSLNVAKIISKLINNQEIEVLFMGNVNKLMYELIQKESPHLNIFSLKTEKDPNYTVALQFKSHENQLNAVYSNFDITDLSFDSLSLLLTSQIIPFSNIGLNENATQLFDFLSSYFLELKKYAKIFALKNDNLDIINDLIAITMDLEELKYFKISFPFEISDLYDQNLLIEGMKNINNKIFYFDPSTLEKFSQYEWLQEFFKVKFPQLPGHKIISLNLTEYTILINNNIVLDLFLNSKNCYLIIHDKKEVKIYKSSLIKPEIIKVNQLEIEKIKNTVGAGDAFMAGLLLEFADNNDIKKAVLKGIKIAQRFISGYL